MRLYKSLMNVVSAGRERMSVRGGGYYQDLLCSRSFGDFIHCCFAAKVKGDLGISLEFGISIILLVYLY